MKKLALLLAIVCAFTAPSPARADSTLDDVIKRGTLIVGISLGTPPYGITNAQMEPDGYDVGIARLLAREMGVKLQIVDIVAANRIPSLTSSKVDIVISSFSITAERAKAIAFTNTIYVDQQVAVSAEGTTLTKLTDFKGKRIGVTRASTNDIVTTRLVTDATIQRYDDDASTSQAILAGQVDAIVSSRALAVAIRDRNPAMKLAVKFVVAQAPMAIGLRRGDADMLHWLNTAIFMLWTTRDIQALQEKWFGAALDDMPRY